VNTKENSKHNIELPKDDTLFELNEESEFIFDHPEIHDFINVDNEIIALSEPVRLITSICPNCAEKTDLDLAQVPENGCVITCSSCNKKNQIIRESCACRAKRRPYEINCANCGKLLDQHSYCISCGKPFPDYFVTVNLDAARSEARRKFFYKKWTAIKDLNITFEYISFARSQNVTHGYSPASRTIKSASETSSLPSRKTAIFAALFIVTVVLIASGVLAYNSYKSSQSYAQNYIKTLYCIKTGVDANLQTCASLKAEWGTASASGKSFYPSINNKDEMMSTKLRGAVDKYMQKLAEPPNKFLQANESLIKIHKIYLDSGALMQSKPSSLQEFSNSINSITNNMSLASRDLKLNFPDSLKQELEVAKLKYAALKDF
jgi:hypothetical protein